MNFIRSYMQAIISLLNQYLYFFLFNTRKRNVRVTDIRSATTTELHMPLIPNIPGSSKTAEHSNTRVRKKAISAEVSPSFKAVKNDEP